MSILTRQRPDADAAGTEVTVMSDREDVAQLFGATPRANLMPPEMGAAKKEASARRMMRFIVVLVVIIMLAAVGGSFYFATAAENGYAQAQQESQSLTAQKAGFGDVIVMQSDLSLAEASLKVAGSTDIQWGSYLQGLQSALPKGVTIESIAIDSEDPTTPYAQSTVPLEGKRIGTIALTGSSATLPKVSDWVDGLSSLPGFVDAVPGTVTLGDAAGGGYSASVTMHIDEGAFSQRFAKLEAAK